MIIVNPVTVLAQSGPAKLDIPPCPAESQRFFIPDPSKPTWTGCRDKKGLYQGILIQFSNQAEILRIASVKDSLRDGKEIRFGAPGTIEERHFTKGHLNKSSFLFKSDAILGRLMPRPVTTKDWQSFSEASDTSLLKWWVKHDPVSTIVYQDGRLVRLEFEKKIYTFSVSKDGHIKSLNHPEMKGMSFIDPEPLWALNAADLKAALLPGFGSCKKYAGPISRFGRHYDHLLYKREPSEKKHTDALDEIRARFINFCVPEDLRQNLGSLECPPQLPAIRQTQLRLIPVSDQMHIPYQPKYFTFDFTLGRTPEEFLEILNLNGYLKFLSNPEIESNTFNLSPQVKIAIKKTARGVYYKVLKEEGKSAAPESATNADWWTWILIPGQT